MDEEIGSVNHRNHTFILKDTFFRCLSIGHKVFNQGILEGVMNINNRVIKKISLNEESRDLVIQLRGNINAIEAKALDFKKDEHGKIVYLLLDRLIHKSHEDRFECFCDNEWQNGFSVSGCFVSELTGVGGI